MILLSDAVVVMDLGHVQGIDALAAIGEVEILDVVLQECDHNSHPSLVTDIRDAGIKEVVTSPDLARMADKYRNIHDKLSFQDSLCLHYAINHKKLLLTNEKQLRTRCLAESVTSQGTPWIIEQTHANQLRSKEELCRWISVLSRKDRRLPKDDLIRLRQKFGCIDL